LLLYSGTVIWILIYYGATLGGPASATLGMRASGLEMRTWYGAHAISCSGPCMPWAFCVSVSALTPPVLLVGLFNARRRLLHDILFGTVAVDRAAPPRAPPDRRAISRTKVL
jgi:uncharacterized RDD family membrane protein YckC